MTQLADSFQILIIDGNNLAHFLYTNLSPGMKMAPADSFRLIDHLSNYSRQNLHAIEIELCLDRFPYNADTVIDNLRVMGARYPQTGDDLLIDRFWFHHISHHPCLVITNDEYILNEVAQAGGVGMRVFDFVRRPGLTVPVFRDPRELPRAPVADPDEDESKHIMSLNTSIYFRLVEDPRTNKSLKSKPAPQANFSDSTKEQYKPSIQEMKPKPDAVILSERALAVPVKQENTNEVEENGKEVENAVEDRNEPHYYIDLNQWPLLEGARCLMQAFCPAHLTEYKDLIGLLDLNQLGKDDLRALANLLLHTCSGEDNFARRGSLMTRVRLALLKAGGEPVSLSWLASATGLKMHGLKGRVKAKAGRWVNIIE